MDYRNLGRSGLKISEICLGTMTFGRRTDEAESIRIVNSALNAGINFFDTADVYGSGHNELLVGEALKGRRHKLCRALQHWQRRITVRAANPKA